MAFGTHWEWRGFGSVSRELMERLDSLPLLFPTSEDVTDRYLYVPGCLANIKVRFSDLKFKRLLETSGALECWLEDPGENHRFPVGPAELDKLAKDLGVDIPRPAAGSLDLEGLLEVLQRSTPRVVVLSVHKVRWQHEWRESPQADPVTVELARILEPEETWSVGVEASRPEAVAQAVQSLSFSEGIRKRNYVEALEVWARGESVGR